MAELLPAHLESHRADLYAAAKTMEYTMEDFLTYWPFLSNVWKASRPSRTKEGYKAMLCYCRCHTDAVRDREKIVVKGLRKRSYYDQDCTAAMRVVWRKDRQRVFIQPKKPHINHDIDFMDERGTNHAMKCIIKTLMERLDNDRAGVLKHLRTSPFADAFTAAGARHVTPDRIRSAALTSVDIDGPQCSRGVLWGRHLFESPPPSWLKSTEQVTAAAKAADGRPRSVESSTTTGNLAQQAPWGTTIRSSVEPRTLPAGAGTVVIKREPHDHDGEPSTKRQRYVEIRTHSISAVLSEGRGNKTAVQPNPVQMPPSTVKPLSLWWKD